MSSLAKISENLGLSIGLTSENGTQIAIGTPFPTTIVLHQDIVVAGTTHVANLECILEGVELPASVDLVRDIGNLHDVWAIKVMLGDARIGFVPCDVNEVLARLMDGGKKLEATVFEREQLGRWTKLHMEVKLVD